MTPREEGAERNAVLHPIPRRLRWIVAVALGGVVAVRLAGNLGDPPRPLNDSAVRNILTWVGLFVAVASAWFWVSFRSSYARWFRRLVLVAPVAGVLLWLTLFRIVEVSGDLAPRFAWRWQRPADQGLGRVEPSAEGSANLSASSPDDFPEFLGPGRRCWVADPGLATDWARQQPRLLWQRPIGAGWSAFAAVNGYAVTLEQRGEEEWVTCYEITTGRPVWGHAIRARHENPLGGIGPRGTPTIHRGVVYALGATGVLRALEGTAGRPLWQVDLRQRYGLSSADDEAEISWGRAASPLVVDEMVVVPGGGPTGKAKNLVAFSLKSGEVVWESECRRADGVPDQISYASPSLVTLAGRRQIVIVNESTVSGHDPSTGRLLWSHPWPGQSNAQANASQAVPIGDDRVLLSKGYSGGAELLQIIPAGETYTVRTLWKNPRVLQTKFTNVVVHQGHAFGLSEGILECVDLTNGQRRWKAGRYRHGQILGVGDLLLVLSEEGSLHLVPADPTGWKERGAMAVLEGKTWNNLCLVGKKLLVRNSQQAACVELP
jgi:outer membrane protein assembly factor BamB